MKGAFLYMLTNKPHGVLYLGMSNANLCRRIWEHRTSATRGFTWKYNCHRLVWVRAFTDVDAAAGQERRMKRWRRDWKVQLIEKLNPDWSDLYPQYCGEE